MRVPRRWRPSSPTGRAPRVLLVEDQLADNGATRSNLRLVSRWRAERAPVVLATLRRPLPEAAARLPRGVQPVLPTEGHVRLRTSLALGLLMLVRLSRQADVVVAGREIGWGMMLARVAALVTRRPFVVLIRSQPAAAIEHHIQPRLRPANRWALRSAHRLVCITPGLVPTVTALGVDRDRVTVVLNGVDVDDIQAAGARPARVVTAGERPVVVAVGRLARQKGFDVLVRAHAQVRADGVPHRLVVLGEGPDREVLESLCRELGVVDSVELPGFSDDPLPEVASADLFCLPSRWEGFGQSLAEALLLGTPVVAADCPSGPRLLLADGAHGDLVPVDDVDALAAAIGAHLRSPQRLRQAAELGRAWAQDHLGVDRAAAEMLTAVAALARR